VLVGTQRGIEMKLVPQAGLPLETLRVAGLKGKGGATLLRIWRCLFPRCWTRFAYCESTNPSRYSESVATLQGRCFWRLGLGECRMSSSNQMPSRVYDKVLARISKRIAIGYEISAQIWVTKQLLPGVPCGRSFFSIAPRTLEKHFVC